MTNKEIGVHLKYIAEYIEKQEEKDIPRRIQDLEFWRKAIIWGAGAVISIGLFIGTTVYNMIIEDVTYKMELVMDRKLKIAFDDLVVDEV